MLGKHRLDHFKQTHLHNETRGESIKLPDISFKLNKTNQTKKSSEIFHLFEMLQLYALRRLMQGSEQTPKAPLGNNARPIQNLHHRTVRTNIDFKQSKVSKNRIIPLNLMCRETRINGDHTECRQL